MSVLLSIANMTPRPTSGDRRKARMSASVYVLPNPMAGGVPKSTRLEASLRHGTEQLERYALLYIAGTSIFAPHQYLGAFPAHLFGVRDSSRHRERLAGSICC